MVAGVVATAGGFEPVIRHPTAQPIPSVTIVVLGGPVLFLAGRARFEYEVFSRVSLSRLAGLLALGATFAAMTLLTPLLTSAIAGLILAGIAITDAILAHRVRPEKPSPSL